MANRFLDDLHVLSFNLTSFVKKIYALNKIDMRSFELHVKISELMRNPSHTSFRKKFIHVLSQEN